MAKRGRPRLIHRWPPLLDYEIEKIKQLTANGMPTELIVRIYGVPEKQLRMVGVVPSPRTVRHSLADEDKLEIYRRSYLMPHKELAKMFGISIERVRSIVQQMKKREVA